MGGDDSETRGLAPVPVRSTSVGEVWATVFCWVCFVVGGVFVPARALVLGAVAGLSLFGAPLQEADRAEVVGEFLVGSISATVVAVVVLSLTVVFMARGRRLDSGWVAGAPASGVAVVAWLLVVLHPTVSP